MPDIYLIYTEIQTLHPVYRVYGDFLGLLASRFDNGWF